MYIANKYKLGFVHIPKTGGTAIIKAMPFGQEGQKHGGVIKRSGFYIFTITRNPYQRLVSYYRFQLQKHPNRINSAWYKDFYSFLTNTGDKFILRQTDLITKEVNVYDYSNIKDDHKKICYEHNVPYKELKRDKHTLYFGQYNWQDYMNKRVIEFINDHCAEDFKLGYKKLTMRHINGQNC